MCEADLSVSYPGAAAVAPSEAAPGAVRLTSADGQDREREQQPERGRMEGAAGAAAAAADKGQLSPRTLKQSSSIAQHNGEQSLHPSIQ